MNITNRQIYDSKLPYPFLYPVNISQDIVTTFHIPSSRLFYKALNSEDILPYLALSDSQQIQRDVAAWLNHTEIPTIYGLIIEDSVSPEIDMVAITEGKKVTLPTNPRAREQRLRSFGFLLDDFRQNEQFHLPSNHSMIELMYSHPFNKTSNFTQASRLADNSTIPEIQNYLNERGVVTFKAEDIINFLPVDIFFYLTRFYGPPVTGDLESKAIERKYIQLAKNGTTKKIARQIASNISIYRQLQKEFDLFFNTLNSIPGYPIQKNFMDPNYPIDEDLTHGIRTRILNNFFAYLKILQVPKNIPLLTLNTVRQLNTTNQEQIIQFLSYYPDNAIIHLIGNIDRLPESRSRDQLLLSAARQLTMNRTFLLLPWEVEFSEICNNSQTIDYEKFDELEHAFVGKGSITTGFTCYDIISDLFDTFAKNTDDNGFVTFIDVSSREPKNLTVEDLKAFREAVASGRGGTQPNKEILKRFDYYINQAEIQSSSNYNGIKAFRKYVAENVENADIVRNVFLNYFYMGMYMRQWKGPGHPYPIEACRTGETVEGEGQAPKTVKKNVAKAAGPFWKYFHQLPKDLQKSFWYFRVYSKQNDRLEDIGYDNNKFWNDVIKTGNHCIRLASDRWSFTGAYYLKQILNEDIPGFDISRSIDHIS